MHAQHLVKTPVVIIPVIAGSTGAPLCAAVPGWRDLGVVYLVNTGITVLLELGCVLGVPTGMCGVSAYAFPAAILSQAAFLNLVPGLVAAVWFLWRRKAGLLAGLVFGLFQVALLADVAIFRLFRRHFDGLIWNVLTTPGASDSVRPGSGTIITTAVALAAMLGVAFWVAAVLAPRLASRSWGGRLLKTGFGLILVCLVLERATFAVVGLYDAAPGGCLRETLPFYQPLTIKRLARGLGFKAHPLAAPALPGARGSVVAPKMPLGPVTSLKRPNIVLIAVEGGRWDALTDSVMPNASRLAREAWWLQNHYSTGNETLFGIFGLFYSLHGTYWNKVLAQQKPSPWLDFLAGQNYEFRIFSCTDLNFPQFRQTAFRNLGSEILDKWDGAHVDRDRHMTDAFMQFLDQRKQQPGLASPFFCFLFYDATHQPYEHPPQDALLPSRFKPGQLNYARLAFSPSLAIEFKNLYLNSMHYVDRQIGRAVEHLRQSGDLDQTVIILVGDHGEEFGECGRFGHISDFSPFQAHTFGVLRLPGEDPKIITNLTSHVDFEPTVLTWMGVTNAVEDYSTGVPIQKAETRSAVVVAGWQKTALIKLESTTIFLQSHTSYLNSHYEPAGSGDPGRPTASEIARMLDEMRRFYR
jgi:membrane-anchored protein YejM (alkaline phosphatase superfamily)